MSTATTSEPVPELDHEAEAQRVAVVHRLAMGKAFHPELRRAEGQVRVQLAAAVIAMDEVEDRIAAVMIAERARPNGVGQALMLAAESWAKAQGAAYVSLASRRAGDFYLALAYEDAATFFKKPLNAQ